MARICCATGDGSRYGAEVTDSKGFMKDKKKRISNAEFDEKFDCGESFLEHLNLSGAVKRVSVDFPAGGR